MSIDKACIQTVNKSAKIVQIVVDGWQFQVVCIEAYLECVAENCLPTKPSQVYLYDVSSHAHSMRWGEMWFLHISTTPMVTTVILFPSRLTSPSSTILIHFLPFTPDTAQITPHPHIRRSTASFRFYATHWPFHTDLVTPHIYTWAEDVWIVTLFEVWIA